MMEEKKQRIMTLLEELGYKPKLDEDGDVCLRYEMKSFYFMPGVDLDDYMTVWFPQFISIPEDEVPQFLAISNKCSREMRMAKVYVDSTMASVSASCEFYFNNEESQKYLMQQSIETLARIRSAFYKIQADLSE